MVIVVARMVVEGPWMVLVSHPRASLGRFVSSSFLPWYSLGIFGVQRERECVRMCFASKDDVYAPAKKFGLIDKSSADIIGL
jgi:hypothetical protein